MKFAVTTVCAILIVSLEVQQVVARPNSRIKRISDSHLSDLETKIALNNKIKGFAITMPVGAGRIDPLRIGRRRRSDSGLLDRILNQSDEDNGDNLQQLDYDDFLYNYYNYLH